MEYVDYKLYSKKKKLTAAKAWIQDYKIDHLLLQKK